MDRLQKFEHSNSNGIAHDLVAFGCQMQPVIPELCALVLIDTRISDCTKEIKRITVE